MQIVFVVFGGLEGRRVSRRWRWAKEAACWEREAVFLDWSVCLEGIARVVLSEQIIRLRLPEDGRRGTESPKRFGLRLSKQIVRLRLSKQVIGLRLAEARRRSAKSAKRPGLRLSKTGESISSTKPSKKGGGLRLRWQRRHEPENDLFHLEGAHQRHHIYEPALLNRDKVA